MKSLQFYIDNICADFTVDTLSKLIHDRVATGPSTVDQITLDVAKADGTLDPKTAGQLAEAAVQVLAESGDLAVDGTTVSAAGVGSR